VARERVLFAARDEMPASKLCEDPDLMSIEIRVFVSLRHRRLSVRVYGGRAGAAVFSPRAI